MKHTDDYQTRHQRFGLPRPIAAGHQRKPWLFGVAFLMMLLFVTPPVLATTELKWASLGIRNYQGVTNGTVLSESSGAVSATVTWEVINSDPDTHDINPAHNSTRKDYYEDFVAFYENQMPNTVEDNDGAVLNFKSDHFDPDDRVVLTIQFSKAVKGLNFSLSDINGNSGLSWWDGVEIFYNGNNNVRDSNSTRFVSHGTGVEESSEDHHPYMKGYYGTAGAAGDNDTIYLDFGNTAVSDIKIKYFSVKVGNEDSKTFDTQYIAISDLTINPILEIRKTVDPPDGTAVAPDQELTYTIEVENIGDVDAHNITVSDILPAGTSYVPESTVAGGYKTPEVSIITDDFESGSSGGSPGWVGSWQASSNGYSNILQIVIRGNDTEKYLLSDDAYIYRGVDLSGKSVAEITYNWTNYNNNVGVNDEVKAWICNTSPPPSSPSTSSNCFELTQDNNQRVSDPTYLTNNSVLLIAVSGYTSSSGEYLMLDNVQIMAKSSSSAQMTQTKDNDPASANDDLISGELSDSDSTLVEADDSFSLPKGQTMTTSFRVKVNKPFDGVSPIENKATTTANGIDSPIESNVVENPLAPALKITKKLQNTAPYTAGDVVTYTVTVTNTGYSTAENVMVTDPADPNLNLTGLSMDPSGSFDLGPGESRDITVTGTILSTLPVNGLPKEFTNTATATADNVTGEVNATVSDKACAVGEIQNRVEISRAVTDPDNSNDYSVVCSLRLPNISGYAWYDKDKDGLQTGSGYDYEGITVQLINSSNGTVIKAVTTDSHGNYQFIGVDTNTSYKVKFILPDGHKAVATAKDVNGNGNDSNDSDISQDENSSSNVVSGSTDPFTISYGEDVKMDAGFKQDPTRAAISSFTAALENGKVTVSWETLSEEGTVSFDLERQGANDQFGKVNANPLPGLFDAPIGGSYRYVDTVAEAGKTYTYRLKEQEFNGGVKYHGPFTVTIGNNNSEDVTRNDQRATLHSLPFGADKPDSRSTRASKGFKRVAMGADEYFEQKINTLARKTKTTDLQLKARSVASKNQKRKATTAATRLKINIREEGICKLSVADISQGLDASEKEVKRWIRFGHLALSNMGLPVVWHRLNGQDGICFYGEKTDSQYSLDNVYVLEYKRWGGIGNIDLLDWVWPVAPAVMNGGFETTLHVEKDLKALPSNYTDPEADFWSWALMVARTAGTTPVVREANLVFDANGFLSEKTVTLAVNVQGNQNVTHQVDVWINEVSVDTFTFEGGADHTAQVVVPAGTLTDGENHVRLVPIAPADGGISVILLDSLDLVYKKAFVAKDDKLILTAGDNANVTIAGFSAEPQLYNISNPAEMKKVNGAKVSNDAAGGYQLSFRPASADTRYLALTPAAFTALSEENLLVDAASDLHNTANAVDYLVITPEELTEEAQRLADYRQGQGLIAKVVLLEDIYDEFNHGIAHPDALKDFLAYTWQMWAQAPKYVVRCGDATYDYKNILGSGENMMPAKLVETPSGLRASENHFADVDGSNDSVPEMAIGIIPADDAAGLSAVIDKIIAWESGAGIDAKKVLLAADNPDNGGDFHLSSDQLQNLVNPDYAVEKVYLGQMEVGEAKQQFVDGINNGAYLVNYVGHGTIGAFAVENLLGVKSLSQLANQGKLAIFSAMTCSSGTYEFPGYDAIGERLVTMPDKGAVAFWGPTGLSLNNLAETLNQGYVEALFSGENKRLGDAVTQSLRAYREEGLLPFMLDIYAIIGDPALKLQ